MSPAADRPRSLARSLGSFRFALSGLARVVATQSNAKVHLLATLIVVGVGAWLGLSVAEWLWIACAVSVVWLAEAFNTAIEAVVDLVSPEPHPLARTAKDVAAGGVLVAAVFAVVVAALVLVPAWAA